MKTIEGRWFCGRDNIGIVKVVDVHSKEVEYRIGIVAGHNVGDDLQSIADYGSRFPNDAGDVLFSN